MKTIRRQYTNITSTHWNRQNNLLISCDYPFKETILRQSWQRTRDNNPVQCYSQETKLFLLCGAHPIKMRAG
jgi:hypothetical protein